MTAFLVLLFTLPAHAAPEIRFLQPERAVWVRGFRHERPASMDDILAADRKQGWGVTEHDPASDTFSLRASLWIGGTSSWEPTHFQIGR